MQTTIDIYPSTKPAWLRTVAAQATREHHAAFRATPEPPVLGFTDIASTVDLAGVLDLATMLNRKMAIRRGVRLQCHALGQVVGSCDQEAVLEKVCALLRHAIRNAAGGSVVTGRGRFRKGQVELHIRYARAAPDEAADITEIDWIDEIWTWSPDDVALAAHGTHQVPTV